jgi:hypothetical protein
MEGLRTLTQEEQELRMSSPEVEIKKDKGPRCEHWRSRYNPKNANQSRHHEEKLCRQKLNQPIARPVVG